MARLTHALTSWRPLKGQTWQVEEMLKLFLVILVFGGAVLLIIGATGGLTSVFTKFCEENPEWCGAATKDQYAIAKASFEALREAINCVSEPDSCMCIVGPCRFRPDTSIQASFFEMVSAQGNDDTVIVECKQEEVSTTKSEPVIIFENRLLPTSVAEEMCNANCDEGCDPLLTTSGGALSYGTVRDNTLLKFTCGYSIDNTRTQIIESFTLHDAHAECVNWIQTNYGITLTEGEKAGVAEDSERGKLELFFDGTIQNNNPTNTIKTKARKCDCILPLANGGSMKYDVFGFTDNEASEICIEDYKSFRFMFSSSKECCYGNECFIPGWEGCHLEDDGKIHCCRDQPYDALLGCENDATMSNTPVDCATGCEDYEGDLVFSPGTKLLDIYSYTCKHDIYEKQPLSCNVTNFNLPENFAGIFAKPKEYISGYLDPSFKVYWQRFPTGEDAAWSGYAEWFQGAGTVLLGALCVGPIISKVWKGLKYTWGIISLKNLRTAEVAGKDIVLNEIKSLDDFLLKGSKANGATDEVLFQFSKKGDVYIVKEGIEGTIGASKVAKDIFNAKVVEEFGTFSNYLNKIEGNIGRLGNLEKAFAAASKGESTGVNLFEYLTKAEKIAMMKKVFGVSSDEMKYIESVMAKEGIVGISAYVATVIDKKMSDNTNKPDSLVLSRAMKPDPDILSLKDMDDDNAKASGSLVERGMPVILDKNEGGLLGKHEQSPFFLASPCHADIEVSRADIKCREGYSYNSKTGETTCLSPEVIEEKPEDVKECGRLRTTWGKDLSVDDIVISKAEEFITNLNTEGTIFTQNTEATNEWKIHDPINDMDYYFSGTGTSIEEQKVYSVFKGFGFELDAENCESMAISKLFEDFGEKGESVEGLAEEEHIGVCSLNTDDPEIFFRTDCDETSKDCFKSPYDDINGGVEMKILGHLTDADSEKIESIYGLLLSYNHYIVTGYATGQMNYDHVLLLDKNNDKKVDIIYHRSVMQIIIPGAPFTAYYSNYQDTDYDGTIDVFSEGYDGMKGERGCRVSGIMAKPTKSKYSGKDGNKYNFCYQEETYTGAALMAASLGADASSLVVPSPYTWAASVVTNCGLFIYHATSNHAWPGDEYN